MLDPIRLTFAEPSVERAYRMEISAMLRQSVWGNATLIIINVSALFSGATQLDDHGIAWVDAPCYRMYPRLIPLQMSLIGMSGLLVKDTVFGTTLRLRLAKVSEGEFAHWIVVQSGLVAMTFGLIAYTFMSQLELRGSTSCATEPMYSNVGCIVGLISIGFLLFLQHVFSFPFYARLHILFCIAGTLFCAFNFHMSSMDATTERLLAILFPAIGECMGYIVQRRMRHQFTQSRAT